MAVSVRTGQAWKKRIGDKAFYSPDLQDRKYYMMKNAFVTQNTECECYSFEEVEIYD